MIRNSLCYSRELSPACGGILDSPTTLPTLSGSWGESGLQALRICTVLGSFYFLKSVPSRLSGLDGYNLVTAGIEQ
jgi:hypothetical protein